MKTPAGGTLHRVTLQITFPPSRDPDQALALIERLLVGDDRCVLFEDQAGLITLGELSKLIPCEITWTERVDSINLQVRTTEALLYVPLTPRHICDNVLYDWREGLHRLRLGRMRADNLRQVSFITADAA